MGRVLLAKMKTALLVVSLIGLASCSILNGRIVGGLEARGGQFPHQISLRFKGSHNCGGSIISSKYILTAAHCVYMSGNEA